MKNETTELMPVEAMPLARSEKSLSIEQAFEAVVNGDMNAEKLAVMKDLLAMAAEQKFNVAFVKLQSELPVIVAESVIPNRGKYQRFEDILSKDGVAKILQNNGFTVSFDQDFSDNPARIIVTCCLAHIGGHKRTNKYAARVGGKSDSETQADSKTSTTAKRNALIQALNLTIRQDCLNEEDDARLEGNPDDKVTTFQATEMEHRAKMLNCEKAFLEFAKASKFSEIRAARYAELDQLLTRKERGTTK